MSLTPPRIALSRSTSSRIGRTAAIASLAALAAACAHKAPPAPGPTAYNGPSADGGPPPPPPPGGVGVGSEQAIPGSERDFIINAGDRVYFDFNAYTVSDQGRGTLDQQSAWLQRYAQVAVRVEGNCDERGTREYNFALGARRAEAVKSYLVSRGVNPARITAISYGKERPIDPGTGEDAYAHNRNGHTALTGGAAGGGAQ